MRRERTYSIRWNSGARLATLLLALAAPAVAQLPVITSLQSSFTGGPAGPVQGVTINSIFPDFTIYLNGSFDPNQSPTVLWSDPVTNSSVYLSPISITASQIKVSVPQNYYNSSAVGLQQRNVQITVQQYFDTSNPVPFTLYPPMSSPATPLPVATVGVPYSTAIVNGGTAPYNVGPGNTAVPGLTIGAGAGNRFVAGTPTSPGLYSIGPTIEDAWNNLLTPTLTLQVVSNATISTVSPNAAPAGSGLTTITVNGSNFLDPQQNQGSGSIVQWTFNNVVTKLATTYVNAGQLTAIVPTSLLAAPGVASVAVLQPNNIPSAGVSFLIGAPVLSSLSRTTANPGSPAVVVILSGSNFASRVGAPDVNLPPFVPVVTFNNTAIASTLNNSGSITATIPSNLLTVPGSFPMLVTNPGGSFTNSINFTVNTALAISTGSLPAGTTATSYSVQLAATGGQTPYTWSATGLPPGLSVNTQSGVIAGVPTATGTFTVNIHVTDFYSSAANASLSLQIGSTLTIVTAALPGGTITTSYSTLLAASGGQSPYTWSAQGLPPGLAINAQTGAISGVPTAAGAFSVNASVTDAFQTTATAVLPIQIGSTLAIATPLLPAGIAGTIYSAQLAATGGHSPYLWSASGLPSGLSVNAQSGAITGTPTAVGTFAVNVRVIDSFQGGATATLSLQVNSNLTITTTTLPAGSAGVPYSTQLAATGGVSPYFWNATGLPPGLSLNNQSGAITGTPTVQGPYAVQVRVSDSIDITVSANLSLQIGNPITITSTSLPIGVTGSAYSARLTATGGQTPYIWSAQNLPPGLSLNSQTGNITGVPTVVGAYSVAVRVTDSIQLTAAATVAIQVNNPPAVITTPSNLPNGIVGVPYSTVIDASGVGPFSYSLSSGQIPDGLRLVSSGLISGTPTRAGTFNFLVVAADTVGNSPNGSFTIVIQPSTLVAGGPSTTLTVGTPASISLTASGGLPPYRFSLICSLPAGLSLSGAIISGTPTTTGVTSCRNVVTDSQGGTAFKDFTITVQPMAVTFTGAPLPAGQVGVAYTARVVATGGVPPFTYSASGLPAGLTLSSSGTISGTPTAAGQSSFTVTATDAAHTDSVAVFTMTIAPAGLSITTAVLADGIVGSAYSASIVAAGGVPPYTFAITGLPAGLTATAAGSITGTPTSPGTFTVAAAVKDNAGGSATAAFTLRITAPQIVITTASVPAGVVGAPYSATFAATGGIAPLTWTGSGAPAGLTVSSAGILSGIPTAPGISNVTVTVRDNTGTTLSKNFTIEITLPAAPALTFNGISSTAPPAQQPRVGVSIATPYPVDVIVILTLTFAPDTGADDPSIQFSSGGRTVRITIPAGSTTGSTDVGLQTGTVAGLITITSQLQASGADVTPTPAPRATIRINPAAPVLTQVTGVRTGTGFTITAIGFVTSREVTQAIFTFNAAPGSTLQTTTLTVTADALFGNYFTGSASAPFGSQFSFTQAFTVNGNLQGIASVTVTLVNRTGSSNVVTVNL